MYNLIVSGINDFWEISPAPFLRSRIFEYTSDHLLHRFSSLEGHALKKLLSLPCIFAYELGLQSNAHIGRVNSVRIMSRDVRIDFEFDHAFSAISPDDLHRLQWELDIGEWEYNRTHWAIKDVNLFHELIRAGLITKKEKLESFFKHSDNQNFQKEFSVRPSIFRVPENGIENDLVSVMRPFDSNFQQIQVALEDACKKLCLRCFDVNQVWIETEIFQEIFPLIYRSKIIICDFSNKNPNVFYEAGIAHTLGRDIIPIVQNPDDIPFDLRHHRHIRYHPNEEGLAKLKEKVSQRIATLCEL